MKFRRGLAALAGTVLIAAGQARAWEVALTVEEPLGKAGRRYVTGGVPLLAGQAKDVADLHLAQKDPSGTLVAVPAQFRELARWWRGDKSIRWVLVDFQTDLKGRERQTFVLTDARPAPLAASAAVKVQQSADAIMIDTGPAQFVVPKGKAGFTFLASAVVGGEELLDPTGEQGLVIEDMFGQKYLASAGTKSVAVIESGPMRVRVRAKGVNTAPAGKGYSKGMYQFDVFLDFYAGSATVFADVIIANNFARSVGTPCFKDASLWLKLKGGATGYSILGDRAHAGKLAAGQSVCLYQDYNGADTWRECQGYCLELDVDFHHWQFPEGQTVSFRGYKLWQRARAGEDRPGTPLDERTDQELAAGDHARGTTGVLTERGGLVVHPLNFWQQFPKGVEVFADGRVRVALFPRECKVPHFLEDCSAKGQELVLAFHAKGRPPDPAALADA